jgi:carboxyl-terminal processing protease
MPKMPFYHILPTTYLVGSLCFPITAFSENNSQNLSPVAPPPAPTEDVRRFADTLTLIKNYYVSPMNNHDLFNRAISGILSGLDPDSTVIKTEVLNEVEKGKKLPLDLGLEITIKDDIVTVITPKIGSSAFKAGILPGDYLIKLGNRALQGMTVEEVLPLLQGKEGTFADAVILRKGVNKPLLFHLAFEKSPEESVTSRLLDNQFAYIRISEFQKNTAVEMNKAIDALKRQASDGLKGLVLDLRYNPGGQLDSAVQVADAFLDNKTKNPKMLIMQTRGRISDLQYKAIANPGDILERAPMVVLMNKGSAYGAEIVAGALQDNHRSMILGQPSAGKGSVQTIIPLDNENSLKLTTAWYMTPKGALIQNKGITPDMLVEALQIPKKGPEIADAMRFNEADLKDHLQAGSGSGSVKAEKTGKDIAKAEDLLHEDYQLFSAMSILKGAMLTSEREKMR